GSEDSTLPLQVCASQPHLPANQNPPFRKLQSVRTPPSRFRQCPPLSPNPSAVRSQGNSSAQVQAALVPIAYSANVSAPGIAIPQVSSSQRRPRSHQTHSQRSREPLSRFCRICSSPAM